MRNYRQAAGGRSARLLLWVEHLLVIAGTAMLVWCAAVVVDAIIAQRWARSEFETAVLATSVATPPALKAVAVAAPRVRTIDAGAPIAALSIPRIGLSAMVLHGSDAQTLRRGPGHLENTAFPGEPGNVVIAGHRDSFFWMLQNIRLRDDIFFDTSDGPVQYRVTSVRLVNPRDVSVLAPTDDAVLTLITCYPFWAIGPAPDRFVVRAIRVGWPAAAPARPRNEPPLEPAGSATPEALAPSESVPMAVSSVADDDSVVRQTIERYLRMHGAKLVTCDVTFSDDGATADCSSVALIASDERRERIFTLERSSDAWAIRSITLK
jgi:sortase A